MFIPPPINPEEHLMHERNRRGAENRDARNGRPRNGPGIMTTGDKIIFLVLGIAMLGGIWFLFSWLSS